MIPLKKQNDNIIGRIKSNDKTALKVLFNQYFNMLCNIAIRYTKDKDAAKDVVQGVFIKFWEKRSGLDIKTSEKSYLCRMTINEAISYLRKEKKHLHDEIAFDLSDHQNSEGDVIQTEAITTIHKAIDTLPPRCQLIFKMSRFEEMTYKQIATQLEISQKTVEHQMGKALKILRGLLKK